MDWSLASTVGGAIIAVTVLWLQIMRLMDNRLAIIMSLIDLIIVGLVLTVAVRGVEYSPLSKERRKGRQWEYLICWVARYSLPTLRREGNSITCLSFANDCSCSLSLSLSFFLSFYIGSAKCPCTDRCIIDLADYDCWVELLAHRLELIMPPLRTE